MSTPTLVVIAVVVLFAFMALRRSGNQIGSDEAHALVADGARLVDVRTPGEYSAGHLPDAVNIPLAELQRRAPEELSAEDTIVVYCRSGARSAQATRILSGLGIERVHDLGGMHRW